MDIVPNVSMYIDMPNFRYIEYSIPGILRIIGNISKFRYIGISIFRYLATYRSFDRSEYRTVGISCVLYRTCFDLLCPLAFLSIFVLILNESHGNARRRAKTVRCDTSKVPIFRNISIYSIPLYRKISNFRYIEISNFRYMEISNSRHITIYRTLDISKYRTVDISYRTVFRLSLIFP